MCIDFPDFRCFFHIFLHLPEIFQLFPWLFTPPFSSFPSCVPGRAGEAEAAHVALVPGAGAGGAALGDADGAHLAEDLAVSGAWGMDGGWI